MTTYVLIHGGWHTGELLEPVAEAIRAAGHTVHCPTIAGNNPGDSRRIGLETAIASIVDFLTGHDLTEVVLMGHSYGGMIITGVADRVPGRIRRLVYWNAFVPNPGEALIDMVPPHYVELFDQLAAQSEDNSVSMPFSVWREAFMNDADVALAESAFARLNPQPYATCTDPIALSQPPADMEIAKSYLHSTADTALPQSLGWHPRLSEKLGLFRLVCIPGGHELCFTDPGALAAGILLAGRD